MTSNKVILIGGAPGAGKTTLGSALAVKLGVTSLTIDDLVTAVIGVTSRESHPGIHALRKGPHTEYFTNSSVDELIADAILRHEASWPMVRQLIQKYTKRMRQNSFETVLIMRLLFLPYDLVNYAAGFLKIKWQPFILATAIGSIPGTISFVLFGSSFGTLDELVAGDVQVNPVTLALSIALILVSIGLSRFIKRREATS